ncbi:MAG: hypothetical protein ACHQ4J_12055 [Candidatus Binatia bacterium]|jgi:hypothetical protein
MRALLFACILVLATAGAGQARRFQPLAPIHVRIVAYVGKTIDGTRPDFDWPVQYRGKRYELYVLNLTVLGGNVTPLDIDAAVAPYRIKFQVAGEKTALERFTATPPRQQIVINGFIRLDPTARYLMLDTVEGTPAVTPAARPSSATEAH